METDYAQEASSPKSPQPCYGTTISLVLTAAMAEALALGYEININGSTYRELIPAKDAAAALTDVERKNVAASVRRMLGPSYHVWPDLE